MDKDPFIYLVSVGPDGISHPTAAFTFSEAAEDYAQTASIEKFKEVALDDFFGYRIPEHEVDELPDKYTVDRQRNCLASVSELSDDDIIEALDFLDIVLYSVNKVRLYC